MSFLRIGGNIVGGTGHQMYPIVLAFVVRDSIREIPETPLLPSERAGIEHKAPSWCAGGIFL